MWTSRISATDTTHEDCNSCGTSTDCGRTAQQLVFVGWAPGCLKKLERCVDQTPPCSLRRQQRGQAEVGRKWPAHAVHSAMPGRYILANYCHTFPVCNNQNDEYSCCCCVLLNNCISNWLWKKPKIRLDNKRIYEQI